jgi:hypothetical protein
LVDIPRQDIGLRIVQKVMTGGQTGVDRAALDVALTLGIACGGWCPKGRRAEDGPIPDRYPLQETPDANVAQRTGWNARDSDGTLVITEGPATAGTASTIDLTVVFRKPCLVVDVSDSSDPASERSVAEIVAWIIENDIHTLNVAGPRESTAPGIYQRAASLLSLMLSNLPTHAPSHHT